MPEIRCTTLSKALKSLDRPGGSGQTPEVGHADPSIFYMGDLELLARQSIAVIGSREVSEAGACRARRLCRELSDAGVTVVSGLARGVDVNAHRAAINAGGKTAAVIGTPLDRVYPAEHAELQNEIARRFLLVTPFAPGSATSPSNFPKRNRLMAALTDGTVIVEASDRSGTIHQADECRRLGRWLFIMKSVADDPSLRWPRRYLGYEKMLVIGSTEDVLGALQK